MSGRYLKSAASGFLLILSGLISSAPSNAGVITYQLNGVFDFVSAAAGDFDRVRPGTAFTHMNFKGFDASAPSARQSLAVAKIM
tara:strand:- start:185 stop:436 length:252 start_codon:yes stop_codon:yes gene_type:complete